MLKVLIPTDGSAEALCAVDHALQLVKQGLHARFVVANVQDPATLYEMVIAHDPVVLERIREVAGKDLMHSAISLLQASGQQVEQVVVTGDPARMLVDIVERFGCDTVIMGSHGAGGLGRVLQGSVALDMAQLSPVPVTLVKPVVASERAQESTQESTQEPAQKSAQHPVQERATTLAAAA